MKNYVLVIDEGTTGTRALIFDKQFKIVAQSYENSPSTPRPRTRSSTTPWRSMKERQHVQKAFAASGIKPEEIAPSASPTSGPPPSCGIRRRANPLPRHRLAGQPHGRKMRGAERLRLGRKGEKSHGLDHCPGLFLADARMALKNNPAVKAKVDAKEALCGTIDTWLVWKLTGGKVHAVSYSNASVMGSLDLSTADWYTEFLDILGIPLTSCPKSARIPAITARPTRRSSARPSRSAPASQTSTPPFTPRAPHPGTAKLTNGTGSFGCEHRRQVRGAGRRDQHRHRLEDQRKDSLRHGRLRGCHRLRHPVAEGRAEHHRKIRRFRSPGKERDRHQRRVLRARPDRPWRAVLGSFARGTIIGITAAPQRPTSAAQRWRPSPSRSRTSPTTSAKTPATRSRRSRSTAARPPTTCSPSSLQTFWTARWPGPLPWKPQAWARPDGGALRRDLDGSGLRGAVEYDAEFTAASRTTSAKPATPNGARPSSAAPTGSSTKRRKRTFRALRSSGRAERPVTSLVGRPEPGGFCRGFVP